MPGGWSKSHESIDWTRARYRQHVGRARAKAQAAGYTVFRLVRLDGWCFFHESDVADRRRRRDRYPTEESAWLAAASLVRRKNRNAWMRAYKKRIKAAAEKACAGSGSPPS